MKGDPVHAMGLWIHRKYHHCRRSLLEKILIVIRADCSGAARNDDVCVRESSMVRNTYRFFHLI
ncbi:hypothetical protein D3C84_1201950 [compost metagenome]